MIEADRNVLYLEVYSADGKIVRVMTDFEMQGDKLILKQFHIEEGTRGAIGPRELKLTLEEFAKEIGRQQGAKTVRIEGGIRKADSVNPGTPRPVEIEAE